MSKKYEYNYVKEFFKKEGYQLLSVEYKNHNDKMDIICNKGHNIKMDFKSFKEGHRCYQCCKNKKYNYQEVKNYIESFNYTLLSNEYITSNKKLEIKCDKGHIYNVTFSHFKNGIRCPECVGLKPHSYEYIKNYIESFNYTLLSNEYKNNKTKLKVRCEKGHEYEVRFDSFKKGVRCPICNRIKTSSKGEKEVLNYIKPMYSGKIIENDRTQILNPLTNHFLELDIYLPEIKFAIEYNGEYFHSNKYQIKKDKIKKEQCEMLGIDLLIIKEKN